MIKKKDTAPEGTAPEGTAPEDTAPEGTAPEDTAPEGAAPEDTAPEEMKYVQFAIDPDRMLASITPECAEALTEDDIQNAITILRLLLIEKRYGGESDETIEVCVLTQFYDKYTGRQYAPGTILVCTRARAMEIEVNLGEGYIEPHSADE